MAKSQENPYLHLLDEEVNQQAKQNDKVQPKLADLPMEQVFKDLPNIDQMSKLKRDDFKVFEIVKEQEHAAAKTLQLIHDEEQPRPEIDKGKAKVESDYPLYPAQGLWMNLLGPPRFSK